MHDEYTYCDACFKVLSDHKVNFPECFLAALIIQPSTVLWTLWIIACHSNKWELWKRNTSKGAVGGKHSPLWQVWRCKAKSPENTWLWQSSILTLGRALHSVVFPLSGTWRTCIGARCPASRWYSQEKCPGGTWTVRLELLWCGHSICLGTMGGLPGGYGASVHSLPSDRSAHAGWPGG